MKIADWLVANYPIVDYELCAMIKLVMGSFVMSFTRYFAVTVLLALLQFPAADYALGRQWRQTPSGLAMDYTQIVDDRSVTEQVMVWWFVAEIMNTKSEIEEFRSIMGKYVMLGVLHFDISAQGEFLFRNPEAVVVSADDGISRAPIEFEKLPPFVIGFVTVMQTMASQAIGNMGQGIHWFVFESKGIDSCKTGKVLVFYDSETYDYQTPIPGCQ